LNCHRKEFLRKCNFRKFFSFDCDDAFFDFECFWIINNNKIKAIDPEKRFSVTFLGTGEPGKADDPAQFDEPGGLSVAGDKLYVADTNNHAIRVVNLKTNKMTTLVLDGLTPPKKPEAQ